MTVDLLTGLARANLALAAAVLLILLLRRPARRQFGARVSYALWITAPLAAAASLLPQAPEPTALGAVVLTAADRAGGAIPAALATDRARDLLGVLWLAGAIAAASIMAHRQARYMASLGRLSPASPGVLRAEHPGIGPAVVGALRPRIVTPADFDTRFAPAEREVILAHERVHVAAGDAAINALAAAVQCLCWFNPFAHLAAHTLRVDQELACDAAVLARYPNARRLYAEVLLKTQLAAQPLPLGCHWPAASDHPLQERIVMLKLPPPAPARRAVGASFVAAFALAGSAAAWAAQPAGSPALVAAPDWILRPSGAEVARVYPAAARALGLSGRALLTCRVAGDGRLADCAVKAQDPAFGDAALQLAAAFQMAARAKDGAPTAGGQVRIPILFRPPAE